MTGPEPSDEFTAKRNLNTIASEHARALVSLVYEAADRVSEIRKLGLSFEGVAARVWSHLGAAAVDALSAEQFATLYGGILSLTSAFYVTVEGESDADRLRRIARIGGGQTTDGTASRFMEAAERMADRIDAEAVPPFLAPRSIETTIRRLLTDAPAPLPNQAPALECAIMLVNGHPVEGILSESPDGGLRMMSANTDPRIANERGVTHMIEQFFDYADVICIAVRRKITIERSPLVTAS